MREEYDRTAPWFSMMEGPNLLTLGWPQIFIPGCDILDRMSVQNSGRYLNYRFLSSPSFRIDQVAKCWHGIWPGGLCGFWSNAAGIRLVACGPHGPPPAPIPRSRASPGSDARHRSPNVILGFAEYSLFFPIYICLFFSLSLLFRQSLLYDSQFNISIRTQLITTQGRTLWTLHWGSYLGHRSNHVRTMFA